MAQKETVQTETTNTAAATAAATANANVAASLFGDMGMLRDIIMGPKVIEYDQRLADLEELIKKNEEATRIRFENLERDMNTRFDRLERLLLDNTQTLRNEMRNLSKSDRSSLADMLVQVSHKLITEK